jgi:hypothetical protein
MSRFPPDESAGGEAALGGGESGAFDEAGSGIELITFYFGRDATFFFPELRTSTVTFSE